MMQDRDAGRYNPFFTRAGGAPPNTTSNTVAVPGGGAVPADSPAVRYTMSLNRATTTTATATNNVWMPAASATGVQVGGRRSPFAATPPSSTLPPHHQRSHSSDGLPGLLQQRAGIEMTTRVEQDLLLAKQLIQAQTRQIEALTDELGATRKEYTSLSATHQQMKTDSLHQSTCRGVVSFGCFSQLANHRS